MAKSKSVIGYNKRKTSRLTEESGHRRSKIPPLPQLRQLAYERKLRELGYWAKISILLPGLRGMSVASPASGGVVVLGYLSES